MKHHVGVLTPPQKHHLTLTENLIWTQGLLLAVMNMKPNATGLHLSSISCPDKWARHRFETHFKEDPQLEQFAKVFESAFGCMNLANTKTLEYFAASRYNSAAGGIVYIKCHDVDLRELLDGTFVSSCKHSLQLASFKGCRFPSASGKLGHMRDLRGLNMKRTGSTDQLANALPCLTKLVVLSLARNPEITTHVLASIAKLPVLAHLDLSGLTGVLDFTLLRDMTRLQTLKLTHLDTIGAKTLAAIGSLKTLRVLLIGINEPNSDADLSLLLTKHIGNLSTLHSLSTTNLPITTETIAALVPYQRLSLLSLVRCCVTRDLLYTLRPIRKKLKKLHVTVQPTHTWFYHPPDVCFDGMEKLQCVNMDVGPRFAENAYRHMEHIRLLENLNLPELLETFKMDIRAGRDACIQTRYPRVFKSLEAHRSAVSARSQQKGHHRASLSVYL